VQHLLDLHGDHVSTCKSHSGFSQQALYHDHVPDTRIRKPQHCKFCLTEDCESSTNAIEAIQELAREEKRKAKRALMPSASERLCEFPPNTVEGRSLHCNNIAESIPYTVSTCEFGISGQNCTNMMASTDVLIVQPVDWIKHSGKAERGLFCMASHLCAGSWVASFGEMMESVKLSRTIGYCMEVQERAGHMAPFINHSCCVEHVNCEYVSTDENDNGVCSVNVRTICDIKSGGPDGAVELLVDVQEVGSGGQAYEELLVCA
jgi:hypothetical protein